MRLRLLLLSPLLLLIILFAVSNTAIVPIGLWPTGLTVEAPLWAAILLAMAVAFALGATTSWFGALPHRRRARRAEAKATTLQAELDAHRLRAAETAAEPSAPRRIVLPPPH